MSNRKINVRRRTETETRVIEESDRLYTCDVCDRQETRYHPQCYWLPPGWQHLALTIAVSENIGSARQGWDLCSSACFNRALGRLAATTGKSIIQV